MLKKTLYLCIFIVIFFNIEKNNANTYGVLVDTTHNKRLKNINSSAHEIRPFLTTDSKNLFFTRKNHNNNIGEYNRGDIWVAAIQNDGSLGLPSNLGYPVNTEADEELVGINLNGTSIYFTRQQQLWQSKQNGRVWEDPQPILLDSINTFKEKFNFFVSIDENYLLFSAKKSTSDDKDIFISIKKNDGTWATPFGLDSGINAENADELGIFLTADTKTLFFSSNRKNGKGGFDWYKTNRQDDTWQKWSAVEWCGDALNSAADDIYMSLSFDEKNAFFTYQNQQNNFDLYYQKVDFNNQNKVVLVKGKVVITDEKPTNEKPTVWYESISNTIENGLVQVDNDGDFSVLLPAKIPTFSIYANQKGYFSSMSEVNFSGENLEMLDGNIDKTHLSKKDSIRNINIEQLLIRTHQLNDMIAKYRGESMDKIDEYRIQSYLPENSPKVEDEKLIKVKETFSNNAYKTTVAINEVLAKKEILKDDESLSLQENNVVSVTRNMYERFKKENQNTSKSNTETPIIINNYQQDREAIDDILSLEGISKSYDNTNLKDLTEKISNQIVVAIKNEIQTDLYNEAIQQWSGWKNMAKNIDETSFFEQKQQDIKRKYSKRIEQYFSKKTNTNITNSKIEQNLYDAIFVDVRNALVTAQRPVINKEVNENLTFLFATELRSKIQVSLEKNMLKMANWEAKHKLNTYNKQNKNTTSLSQTITLYPIENEVTIPLEGIYFFTNSGEILPTSSIEIIRVIKFLEENPSINIELFVHTNSLVTNQFAQNLTTLRATALKNILVAKGISTNRIFAIGQGKTKPLVLNTNEEARLKNQRVEMKIIKRN